MKSQPVTRQEVYAAVDSERRYQSKWDDVESQNIHTETEFVLFMEDYLMEAKHLLARNAAEDVRKEVLDTIRKVTAMGVACMEQHGAPQRV
jgi:hypothetical protein